MKNRFAVADLELLAAMVRSANANDEVNLRASLRKQQPGFLDAIAEVALDPRSARAHRYCVLFCGLALDLAELSAGHQLPSFSEAEFRETGAQIVQGQATIGKRGLTFPKRISQRVLAREGFDHEDGPWLLMMISSFLVVLEESLASR
ncbi:hypothetical protein ACFL59_03480 [Planctomycetota bacterium]